MRRCSRRFIAAVTFAVTLSLGAQVSAEPPLVHHLKFATSAGFAFNDDDADAIVARMNQIIGTGNPAWGWDVGCQRIRFVRDGDVIVSRNLTTDGSFGNLVANLRKVAPDANVYVVATLNCNGPASGCTQMGDEPSIITPVFGLQIDAIVLLHERGHAMNLAHASDRPEGYDGIAAEDAPPTVGFRFMFWQPGADHTGKVQSECSTYSSKRFASISITNQALAQVAVPGNSPLAAAALPEPAAIERTPVMQAAPSPEKLSAENEAKALGLTLAAYQAISRPWLDEGAVEKAIKGLSEADVESIREFLKNNSGGTSSFRLQALQVLGHLGSGTDVALLKDVVNQPISAAPPGKLTYDEREQLRRNIAEKTAATQSLGLLATSAGSADAVETLKRNVDLNQASNIVGKDGAITLSRSALRALSKTPQGAEFVKQILDLTQPKPGATVEQRKTVKPAGSSAILAPPLTPVLRDQLKSNVESAMRNSGG